MKHNWIRITLCVGFVVFLAACNPAVRPNSPENTTFPIPTVGQTREAQTGIPSQSEEESQIPSSLPTPESISMQNLVEKAKQDLSQRLSVSVDQINLVEAKEVVWPDASLGCPQPGMKYKQIPYDGALIVLQVQGAVYEYHSGGSRGLFLCEKLYKDPKLPPKIDLMDLTPRLQNNKTSPPATPNNSIPPGEDQ